MTQPSADEIQRKCVLVVEDEFLIALEVKRALINNGFDVLGPAASVDRALDFLADHRPDAAVLDVNLGTEKVTPVAYLLKSLSVPYILATANDADEIAGHEILADVPNIGKPTDMKRLIEVLQNF